MPRTAEPHAPLSAGRSSPRQRGRPKAELSLREDDREVLDRWSRCSRSTESLALRSRIILRSAEGATNKAVAEEMRITPRMVGKWRARFVDRGLDGLLGEPRPGARRKVPDAAIGRLVTMTLQSKPEGAGRWSTRSMAKASGLTQTTVSRVWRAFGLQPRRRETAERFAGSDLAEEAGDIVGLYLSPPDGVVVFSGDERSRTLDVDRPLPAWRRRPERTPNDDARDATALLFSALEATTRRTAGAFDRRHRSVELRRFLDRVDEVVPERVRLHLVFDDHATGEPPVIHDWLARRPRFLVHFTSAEEPWARFVERLFDVVTEKTLRRGSCPGTQALELAVRRHVDAHDDDPGPFVWTTYAESVVAYPDRLRSRPLDLRL